MGCILSEWFRVTGGLKQGCLLSPLLFNLYINDLICEVSSLGEGVEIGNERIHILLYADDIVLVAQSETNLQKMLDCLNNWCTKWRLKINVEKTKVVHFRRTGEPRTDVNFLCGNETIGIVEQYRYLGLILTEFLDYSVMSKAVALSAGRALGLIIAKSRAYGGIPYNCFTKLYHVLVVLVISYGAAVWGTREFSHVNEIHNRACRFFLGLGKFAPVVAVQGDMGWTLPISHQWAAVTRQWCRLGKMPAERINKKIFQYCYDAAGHRCQNWCFRVRKHYQQRGVPGLSEQADVAHCFTKAAVNRVQQAVMEAEEVKWLTVVNRESARRGAGRNKLRTYNKFKQVFEVEPYVTEVMSRGRRSALAKFRCGVAPIRLETGRYENLPVDQRLCPFCVHTVEDEFHVVLCCPKYEDLRAPLIQAACDINPNLPVISPEMLHFILSNSVICTLSAKTLFLMLKRRREIMYRN